MKLETAYRKLGRHKKRWRITVRHDPDNRPVLQATLQEYKGLQIPEVLCGDELGPDDGQPCWIVWEYGHANAVNAMAEKLDKVERAIKAWEEAERLKKEVTR